MEPGTRYVMVGTSSTRTQSRFLFQARKLLRASGFQILRTDYLFIFPRALSWLRGIEPLFRVCRLVVNTRYSAASLSQTLKYLMTVPTQPATSRTQSYREIRNKIELTDLLFVLYALVFVRQYFWIIQNNSIAWTISVALTLVIGYFYITNKQFRAVRFGWSFWLLVAQRWQHIDSTPIKLVIRSYCQMFRAECSLTGPLGPVITSLRFHSIQSVTLLPVSLVTHSVSGWALQSICCADIGGANYRQAAGLPLIDRPPSISLRSSDFAQKVSCLKSARTVIC
jgi:hypothetical protein